MVPRISMTTALNSIFWMRQIERARVGLVWSGTGGRVQDLPGNVLDEEVGEELGVDPRSGEVGVLGRQLVEAEQALEAFEGELDLPAPAVEGENVGGGKAVGVERGDEQDELGGLEGLRGDPALPLGGGCAGTPAACLGLALGHAPGDQADRKGAARGAFRPDHD